MYEYQFETSRAGPQPVSVAFKYIQNKLHT